VPLTDDQGADLAYEGARLLAWAGAGKPSPDAERRVEFGVAWEPERSARDARLGQNSGAVQ